MSTFVPGPYTLTKWSMTNKNWLAVKPDFVITKGTDVVGVAWCDDEDDRTDEGQAQLFIAAPEMYSVLLKCDVLVSSLPVNTFTFDLMLEIKEALARARGE